MSTHSRIFPCTTPQVTAGKANFSFVNTARICPFPTSCTHGFPGCSATPKHILTRRAKGHLHPVYMGSRTLLQVHTAAHVQDKLTAMDMEVLHPEEIQGTTATRHQQSPQTAAAPQPAPALLRQTAAFRIGPKGRNNVRQMCQV